MWIVWLEDKNPLKTSSFIYSFICFVTLFFFGGGGLRYLGGLPGHSVILVGFVGKKWENSMLHWDMTI